MLYQTLFGAWPDELEPGNRDGLRQFAQRVVRWQEKALREAKLRSSWAEPDEAYEAACRDFIERLLDPGRSNSFAGDLSNFVRQNRAAALSNTLVQTALKYTLPGVPDLYQGCELTDLSLVDPDNRIPVDYDLRQRLLAKDRASSPKLRLIRTALKMRRENSALFTHGSFAVARVAGEREGHVFAFSRRKGDKLLRVAVALRCGAELFGRREPRLPPRWWGDTRITFADGEETIVEAGTVLALGPVSLS